MARYITNKLVKYDKKNKSTIFILHKRFPAGVVYDPNLQQDG